MGLPSGNRWAVSNLDATGPYLFQESPFQYECSFFSWGNVTPHNPISETAFEYDFGGVNPTSPWYEGQPYGDTPGSLLTGDIPLNMDAARRMLGRPWRIPATKDYQELFDYCIFIDADGNEVDSTKVNKRVTVNGVMGIYLQSKINGERLFLSCSGSGINRTWSGRASNGLYQTTSWISARDAHYCRFDNGGVVYNGTSRRRSGLAVRPIWNPRDHHG